MTSEVQESDCPHAGTDPVMIRLGKRKRKDIRKLSKGKGRLFARVVETHSRIRPEGDGQADASGPVFVVVKQKKRKGKMRWGSPWW
jgi:hypothetical protein